MHSCCSFVRNRFANSFELAVVGYNKGEVHFQRRFSCCEVKWAEPKLLYCGAKRICGGIT